MSMAIPERTVLAISSLACLRKVARRPRTTLLVRSIISGCRLECVKRSCRVYQRGACIDTDPNAKRFDNFLPAGAELPRRRGVNTDTAIAAQVDRDSKRD